MIGGPADGGEPRPPHVVVIGGGFCGAATAIHLLRDHAPACLVTVVEPRPRLGAGVAYGTDDPSHRINVAANRMSLFAEEPDRFDHWLRAAGMPDEDPAGVMPDGRLYPRRALFGQHVADTLAAVAAAGPGRLRHARDRAVAAAPEGAGWAIACERGERLRADILVLALSHAAPDLPAVLQPVAGLPGIVADPWAPSALAAVPPDADALVIGTGLTACDVVASLRARGHTGGLTLLSRRGLLPRARTTRPVSPFGVFDRPPAATALALLRQVRRAIAEAAAAGRPWEDVIDALRTQGGAVWRALPSAERHRLLRHLRPFWDVHRFQASPPVADRVAAELAAGSARVVAGRVRAVEAGTAGRFHVTITPRDARRGRVLTLDAGAVVNCTGPDHRAVVSRQPVLATLHETVGLQADAWGLGIAVDDDSRVLGARGPIETLFVAGPLARGTHGELMGLPQVSAQPRSIAARIAALLAGPSDAPG